MNKYANIPEILTSRPNWVVWGIVGEPNKAPFNPGRLLRLDAAPAKSGVPETWGTFAEASTCVEKGLALGIGYEFEQRDAAPNSPTAGRDIYGVDLDHIIGDDGAVAPEALAIVEGLASYTEISPSGRGLHVFVMAEGAEITRHRKQGGFVEIYNRARYFTVTGNVYGGYDRIAERTAELQTLHDRYFIPEQQRNTMPVYSNVGSARSLDDTLRRGLVKDPVLRACWNGGRRRGDESASDQALMNKLAYWLSADQSAMCAAFLQSPYYGQKDDTHKKKCLRPDYLPNTANAACVSLRSTAIADYDRWQNRRREKGYER